MKTRLSSILIHALLLGLLPFILAPEAKAAPNNKATICHRTKSVKNPYRMITVSRSSISGNKGHAGHTTNPTSGVWTTSKVQGDNWEDIIPGGLNWTTAGAQDIYYGRTRTNAGVPACRSMTFSQYYASEKAAGRSDAQIAADLDDGMSDEDKAVLKTFGGSGCNTFAGCSTSISTIATNSKAIAAVTTYATNVTANSATLNGYIKADSNSISYYFEYSTDGTWATEPTRVPGTAAGPIATNTTSALTQNLTGLSSGTTYYYRIVAVYTPAGGTLQEVSGDLVSFEASSTTKYVVRYDANGGTDGLAPVDSKLYPGNSSTKVLANYGELTKNGAAFVGWSLSPGAGLRAAPQTIASSSDLTAIKGSKFYSPLARVSFLKVSASPQYTSGTYAGGDNINIATSNVTLYAIYSTSFNVTYNGNTNTSGSAPTDATNYSSGANVTVLGNTGNLVKPGYTFGGWCTTQPAAGETCSGTTRAAASQFSITASLTLYAIWTANKYTYNGNNADSGSAPADQTYAGSTITARANTFVKSGFSFYGWCLTQHTAGTNCSGTRYTAGASLPIPETATVTLFAIWSNATLYTVTFDTQGGSPVSAITYASGDAITLPAAPTKDGHSFLGWSLQDSAGPYLGETYTASTPANFTIYALWNVNQYTVTYDGNNETAGTEPSAVNVNYNDSHTVLSAGSLEKSGHTFGGWDTEPDGSGTNYAAGETFTVTASLTLYAVWNAASYVVSYNGNSNTGGSAPANQSKVHDVTLTLATNSGTLTRSGFTFVGWNTNSNGNGTSYAEGASYTLNSALVLFAQWSPVVSSGGGVTEPATPQKPVISSISKSSICSTGNQVVIQGANFSGAVVRIDGTVISALSNSGSSIVLNLPAGAVGKKAIEVKTDGGSATTEITYIVADTPKFVKTYIPYLYQGGVFGLLFSASNALSYKAVGQLPLGLELNSLSGSVSGTPMVNGVFSFTIVATGECGDSEQKITLDIDKAVPKAISHRIYFSRNNSQIPAAAIESLERFLNKVKEMSPRYITPQIFITTNTEPNEEESKATQLERDRYQAICDGLIKQSIDAEIITDVFSGDDNMIEIIAYWPNPS